MGFCDAADADADGAGLTAPGALAYALYEGRGRESRVVELFSLSKGHLGGGLRVGWALGSTGAIAALEAVKAPIDFNQWRGLLTAGECALRLPARETSWPVAAEYARRAASLVRSLSAEARWDVSGGAGAAASGASAPAAAMYVWARLPRGWRARRRQGLEGQGVGCEDKDDGTKDEDEDDDDPAFCRDLVLATGVALAPGSGFGPGGRGHVRFALVAPADALAGAAKAIGRFLDGRV